jgi:hypothetical protein
MDSVIYVITRLRTRIAYLVAVEGVGLGGLGGPIGTVWGEEEDMALSHWTCDTFV